MDYVPLNFALLKSPFNWAIIILMVAVAGYGLALILPENSVSQEN